MANHTDPAARTIRGSNSQSFLNANILRHHNSNYLSSTPLVLFSVVVSVAMVLTQFKLHIHISIPKNWRIAKQVSFFDPGGNREKKRKVSWMMVFSRGARLSGNLEGPNGFLWWFG